MLNTLTHIFMLPSVIGSYLSIDEIIFGICSAVVTEMYYDVIRCLQITKNRFYHFKIL